MSLAQGPTNIGETLLGALQAIVSFIPTLIGALIILLIGYIVAKAVQWGLRKGLDKLGLDRRLKETHAGQYLERTSPGTSASRGVGRVAFWLIFVFALVSAIGALDIAAVSAFMNLVLAYLPNVVVAIVIFIIAGLVAGAVGGLAHRTMGETPMGKIAGTVGPTLVMGIAVFMILTQLGIATAIVQITYTALMGAIALGLALAFGLGGRDIAAEMLRTGYDKAQQRERDKTEAQVARERAERDVAEGRRSPAGDEGWVTTATPGQSETQAAESERSPRTTDTR
jgi:hypothetical protein